MIEAAVVVDNLMQMYLIGTQIEIDSSDGPQQSIGTQIESESSEQQIIVQITGLYKKPLCQFDSLQKGKL